MVDVIIAGGTRVEGSGAAVQIPRCRVERGRALASVEPVPPRVIRLMCVIMARSIPGEARMAIGSFFSDISSRGSPLFVCTLSKKLLM